MADIRTLTVEKIRAYHHASAPPLRLPPALRAYQHASPPPPLAPRPPRPPRPPPRGCPPSRDYRCVAGARDGPGGPALTGTRACVAREAGGGTRRRKAAKDGTRRRKAAKGGERRLRRTGGARDKAGDAPTWQRTPAWEARDRPATRDRISTCARRADGTMKRYGHEKCGFSASLEIRGSRHARDGPTGTVSPARDRPATRVTGGMHPDSHPGRARVTLPFHSLARFAAGVLPPPR